MDNLTHTLVGLTLVRAGVGRATPGAMATMLIAANAPDLDIVTAMTGGAVPYLAAHRGWSHGPLGVLTAGLAAAVGIGLLLRRRDDPLRRPSYTALIRVGLVGAALHVLMDLPTTYGIRLLTPFDDTWFAFDWLPIIDVYLWALLVAGLLAAQRLPTRRATIARATLACAIALYAVRVTAHAAALATASSERADGLRSPCRAAPALARHPVAIDTAAPPGACLEAAAIPTFLSPFRWVLIRRYADGYELRDVSLLQPARNTSLWVSTASGAPADAAKHAEAARVLLDFSRMPAIDVTDLPGGGHRVRFLDVRFLRGPFGFGPARRPFVATVVVAPNGAVVSQRLGN